MADLGDWAFPEPMQPDPGTLEFDLQRVLNAVVQVRAEIPDQAFTAPILGTERIGNGVVIRDDGLVLTIGYLITEAQTVWLTSNTGALVAGYPLAYDFATGFGLVMPLGRLPVQALPLGSSAPRSVGDDVIVVGHGGRAHSLKASIFAKREFAGYWEYLLDEAMFTSPGHPQWGGAAVVDGSGQLIGIGSLLVEENVGGEQTQGNMIVPVDLLPPVLETMLSTGQGLSPVRPWLGMYMSESDGQLAVAGIAPGGPAETAGIRQGDLIIEVAGHRVVSLADLFRQIWALGAAGVEVPLALARNGGLTRVKVRSIDRNDLLWKPRLH